MMPPELAYLSSDPRLLRASEATFKLALPSVTGWELHGALGFLRR